MVSHPGIVRNDDRPWASKAWLTRNTYTNLAPFGSSYCDSWAVKLSGYEGRFIDDCLHFHARILSLNPLSLSTQPFFKWNSSTPWSEMQLSPLNVADASTLPQLLKKGYAKLMWIIFLSRVIGYCIKNYYMVNRQAVKLTTTYAGKRSALSAEIATTEVLKSQRKRN